VPHDAKKPTSHRRLSTEDRTVHRLQRAGLPEDALYNYAYPKADNTTSIICYHLRPGDRSGRDELTLLTIRRGKEPYKGMMALPGGFLEVMVRAPPGDAISSSPGETLERCAQRELQEETGIWAPLDDFVLVCVQSEPQRDPRNHVVDHVYCVQVPLQQIGSAKAADDAAELTQLHFERGTADFSGLQDGGWAFDHADSLRRFFHHYLGWL
jgi:ADP-ribose pyrophosphatase YjhB (NUDIX family)